VAALFAFVAPALLTANTSLSFGLFFAFAAIAAAIGLFWVPRLPKATELEPAETVFAPEVRIVPTAQEMRRIGSRGHTAGLP
jgi:hypothetical protein